MRWGLSVVPVAERCRGIVEVKSAVDASKYVLRTRALIRAVTAFSSPFANDSYSYLEAFLDHLM